MAVFAQRSVNQGLFAVDVTLAALPTDFDHDVPVEPAEGTGISAKLVCRSAAIFPRFDGGDLMILDPVVKFYGTGTKVPLIIRIFYGRFPSRKILGSRNGGPGN